MRLIKIQLDDVYGHRDTQVDLSEVDSAAIVGDNGTGKSTLFVYGPLWALYGTKAVQGDSLDDVVRNGAERAIARVTFEIGGDIYRVARTYSQRTKNGKSSLDFERQSGGEWSPVHDGSIREVESAISEVLGLDYDTFTTGSIQTQGDADQFCAATSSERIDFLAELLAVEHYSACYTAAGQQIRTLESDIERMTGELGDLEDVDERIEDVEEQIGELEDKLEELEKIDTGDLEDKLQSRKQDLADITDTYDEIVDKSQKHQKLKHRRQEIARIRDNNRRAFESAADALDKIPDEYVSGVARDDWPFVRILDELNELRERCAEIEQTREDAKDDTDRLKTLESKRESYRERLEELEDDIDRLEDVRVERIDKVRDRLDDIEHPDIGPEDAAKVISGDIDLEDIADRLDAAEQDQKNIVNSARADVEDADRKLEAKRDKLRQLKNQASHIYERNEDVDIDDCRECGLLTAAFDAKDRLEGLREDISDLEDRKEKLVGIHDEAVEQKNDVVETIESDRDRLREMWRLVSRIDEVKGDIDAKKQKKSDIVNDQIEPATMEIEALREKWAIDVTFDDYPVDKVDDDLKVAEHRRDAMDAIARMRMNTEALATCEDLLEDIDEQIAALGIADAADIDEVKQKRASIRDDIDEIEQKLDDAREHNEQIEEKRSDIRVEMSSLREKRDALVDKRDRREDLTDKRADARRQRDLATYARQFFDAAPRIVIGQAIPRIESEANEVLSDTFPGVQIEIRRQKQTKSGELRDKVYLRVLRNGAEQPYSSFSGGEQFLIALAVRMGLAKVAAERSAGKPIDLLVIDEGFGALDPTNVERVQDALVALTDRFEQILVISHVPELKNTFGSVVQLESTAEGTTVDVA